MSDTTKLTGVGISLMTAGELAQHLSDSKENSFRVFDEPEQTVPSIHLPVLYRNRCVVWGFRYIEAAAERDSQTVLPVADISSLTPFEIMHVLLMQENRTDQYSFAEMDRIDRLMTELSLEESEKRRIEPLVQRKGSFRAHLEQYRTLPGMLQAAASNGHVDIRTAVSIADLPEEVVRLACIANIGFSKRRIVLTRLAEIARRDQLNSEQVWGLCKEILSGEDPAAVVYRLRYPELAARQMRSAEMQQRDFAGMRIQLQLPENLEGDSVSITCAVRSREELAAQIAALTSLQEHIDEYLDLL
ncbi:MAG: hypothetical protein ACOC0D_00990 [Spirochaeta sp.]